MWEISNTLQVIDFLRAAVLGIILSVFYGVFSSLRKAGLNSDFAVFLQDIIFFIISSPVIFLFLLATTNGEVRLYIIIGVLAGFLAFKLTLYKIYVFLLSKLFSIVRMVFSFLRRKFFDFVGITGNFFAKIGKKVIFFKKALNTSKKVLKKPH